MTEPTPTPKPAPAPAAAPPAAPPSAADAQAIATAAGTAAAQPNQTAAEAQAAADSAMAAEATARNVALPDAERQAIAGAVIAQLEARGAFDPAPTAPPAGVTPADTSAHPDPNAGNNDASTEPPRKKTFAERFVGRG